MWGLEARAEVALDESADPVDATHDSHAEAERCDQPSAHGTGTPSMVLAANAHPLPPTNSRSQTLTFACSGARFCELPTKRGPHS